MIYYFTYGANHCTKDGVCLANYYTPIEAPSENEARAKMTEARGVKWSFSYADIHMAGVYEYDLKLAPLEDVKLPSLCNSET